MEIVLRDGERTIDARVVVVGDDLVVAVGGGERPHVGSVVVAVAVPSRSRPGGFSPSVSVVTLPPHKEEPIARCVAEKVVRATGRTVVVTAGVHDDGLDRAGVEAYLRLGRRLADELAERLSRGRRCGPPTVSG